LAQHTEIKEFLSASLGRCNIIDVRSPAEFAQGHIPGATNIALFSNDERAIIGTLYKQKSRQEAVLKGLEFVGPRLADLVNQSQNLAEDKQVFVHCWRGGMRSGFVAMLLEMYGLKVLLLKNGYKAFRNHVLQNLNAPRQIALLGGKTGSGKTLILKKLKAAGQQVIDLEGLANHKGSAFGALGEKEQPTQEQFENELSCQLFKMNSELSIWLEDESRLIGKKVIPPILWEQMTAAKVYYLNLPYEARLKYITEEYGKFPKEQLENSLLKIAKRLGSEQTKNAIEALKADDPATAFAYCLSYYDKTYDYGLSQRLPSNVQELNFDSLNAEAIAKHITSINKI
jgi:tRNA 2-selenouridine synthase